VRRAHTQTCMLDLLMKGHTFQKGGATIRLVLLSEYANDPLEFTCSISDIFKNVTPNDWELKCLWFFCERHNFIAGEFSGK